MPRYHSVDEVDKWVEHLKSITRTDQKGHIFLNRDLRKREIEFISNERSLCAIDCGYYLTRYFWISADNKLMHFSFRSGQQVFYRILQELDADNLSKEVQCLKARQQGLCLDPETKVLTASLIWKRIADLSIGEELVGVDEQLSPGETENSKQVSRKMCTTTVEAIKRTVRPGIRLTLENGVKVICSPEHRWLSKGSGGILSWREAVGFRVGDEIRYITEPWSEPTPDDGWYGGIIDGEGYMRKPHEVGAGCAVSQRYGPVYSRIRNYLDQRGYNYQLSEDARGITPSGKLGRDPVGFIEISRMNELFRLIGQTRPTRFIGYHWWKGKGLPGKRTGKAWTSVVGVELLPEQVMIDLQTSSGTFIAEGLVSHNSTITEGIISWMVLFTPGVKAAIASADGQKTQIMMGMLTLAIDMLPWWLPPTQTQDKRQSDRALLAFANIGSMVMVQPGSMRGGIAQGTTPTAIHLSEVCDFTDHQTQIEEGLFKAVHSSPEIFMVLESTGNGNTGWWANQWRNNKEFYWQGKARLLPIFLPWFMTPELYPTPTWIQKFPIPGGWRPSLETKAHMAKCQAYVASNEMLGRVLGKNWILPYEQAWFWEFNYQDAKRRRMEKSWLRQMPADDFEALQGHNDMVYGEDAIVQIDSRIATDDETTLYAVAGEGIEKRHEPDVGLVWYGDDSPARPTCEWTTPKGEHLEWMFVPLSRHGLGKPGFDPLKKFLVWEEPREGADYSIGVDSGTGVGGDRSVICVTRTGHDADCDVQVAEFAADDISNTEIYAWVAAAAAYYAKYMTERPHPKLIIEQRRKYGDTCQHQLRLMGMKRMHEWVTYDKRRFKEHTGSPSARIGWFTNSWSRPMLLGAFKDAVENGWYVVKSSHLATELKEQEQIILASGLSRMDHASGKHDDRIFAAAMSYLTLHHRDVLAERSKKRYASALNEPLIVDTRPYAIEVEVGQGKLFLGGAR